MKRATIREVARRAGVSHQTVSRVINNSPDVAASTRAQVIRAITELDYHPNAQAVGLSRNRTDVIGVVVSTLTSSFFAQIVDGIAQTLRAYGRFPLLACDGSINQQDQIDTLQRSRRIDGMIVVLPLEASLEQVRRLAQSRLPSVLVDLQHRVEANSIAIDNVQGAYTATEHLINLGHRRIAIIRGRGDLPVAQMRIDGYHAALRAYGLPIDPTLSAKGDFLPASGEAAIEQFLALDTPPTAIFASNDLMALGAMLALRRRGYCVPRDISIVGFDDVQEARYTYPPLTTIRQPLWEMGRLASNYICRVIEGSEQSRLHMTMATELVIRHSTAPAEET